jgi:hypothetical protein
MRTADNFWLGNELAPVGSPEPVTRQRNEQHPWLGDGICCASHRLGTIPPEQSSQSLQLFARM